MPSIWCYVLYTPAIPVVGKFLPWTGALLALAWSYFNKEYVPKYMQAAELRIAPFRWRTRIFRVLAVGAIGGMGCSLAHALGLLSVPDVRGF